MKISVRRSGAAAAGAANGSGAPPGAAGPRGTADPPLSMAGRPQPVSRSSAAHTMSTDRRMKSGRGSVRYGSTVIEPSGYGVALGLERATNARDLGGYRTADGRRVRRGLVYRADALSKLSDADVV